MNRRSFFGKLASIALAGRILLEERLSFGVEDEARINPEWVNAPYDVHFWVLEDGVYQPIKFGPPPKNN